MSAHKFKDGDTVIHDRKEVVTLFCKPFRSSTQWMLDCSGIAFVNDGDILPIRTVRIMANGEARDVNPVGEFPDHYGKSHSLQTDQIKTWKEAEAQCATLPYIFSRMHLFPIKENETFYAYEENATFYLIDRTVKS